jgi:GTP:adenosylcobinamide-phosphate guanylyltransferase
VTAVALLGLMCAALGVPVALAAGYLGLLAIGARHRPPRAGCDDTRFDVIVPAHNEADGLPATLRSLAALDYPATRHRIIVVADNCTDETAAVARAHGVHVLERDDPSRRGKGYALDLAFARSATDGFADAVVVVDADSTLSRGALRSFAAVFRDGAEAAQADYRVRNAEDSWRTQLLEYAFTLHHTVRSLGRDRRGWSSGLRGNGMAFRLDTLARVPYAAFSVVEDIEYGLQLGLAGIPVRYVPDAEVLGDMPVAGDAGARAQRARWEEGRKTLRRQWRARLWRATLAGRPLVGDLLADLLVPPLVSLAMAVALGLLASAGLVALGAPGWTLSPWLFAGAGVALYAARGLQLVRDPGATLRALTRLPAFVAWKLLGRRDQAAARRGEWVRTARRAQS